MAVQLVTDSGSDIPPHLAGRYGITVVPLYVTVGGREYRDGADLQPEEFYRKMKEAPELPRTATPSPHDLQAAYQSAGRDGDVLGIHLSSALSGTYQAALLAAGNGAAGRVAVIDSLTGSAGQALLVLEAAEKAQSGTGLDELAEWAKNLAPRIRTLALVENLENAVKGGRVSRVAGLAAEVLDIKQLLHVTSRGKVEQLERVRGRRRAMRRLVELAAEEAKVGGPHLVVIGHSVCEGEANRLAEEVRESIKPRRVDVVPVGATIGTYAGPGALVLAYRRA
jgi:DegV family protein with EDD domain